MAVEENYEIMRSVPKKYFNDIKFVLRLAGTSLDRNPSKAYKLFFCLLFVTINIAYITMNYMEAYKQDISVVLESMSVYLVGFPVGTIKAFVFLKNRHKIVKLLDKLEQPPFSPNPERGGEVEEKLIRRCMRIIFVQNITYWSAGYLSISAACILAFSFRIRSSDYRDWVFPYGPLTVLNVTYSPNYVISCGYQCLIEAGSTNVLNSKITTDNIRGSEILWKYLKVSLQEAIDYHLAIINIAEEVESVFSSLLLVIFTSTLGLLCVTVYVASMVEMGDPQLGRRLGETTCAILQVATVCFWGDRVVTESENVGKAAYQIDFEGTDLRFQKSLIMIIRRSQKPTQLTAGKFSVIYLPTLAWIIRSSYSAFMMMKHVQQTNNQ